MAMANCHFVFSGSFAGSLLKALETAAPGDKVFCLQDDLGFGPINPPDPAMRRDWTRDELQFDFDPSDWPVGQTDDFWKIALSETEHRIVWVSKRVAREYAGFLEWVWRLEDAPYDVVEFDQAEVTYRRPDGATRQSRAIGLALLPHYHLEAERYWDGAAPLNPAARERYRAIWTKLRSENAPLRVFGDRGLVSAPLSFFDEFLISCVVEDWRKVTRVLGEAISRTDDDQFIQTGELMLYARVIALAEAGRLESRGDLSQMRLGEVRLPAG